MFKSRRSATPDLGFATTGAPFDELNGVFRGINGGGDDDLAFFDEVASSCDATDLENPLHILADGLKRRCFALKQMIVSSLWSIPSTVGSERIGSSSVFGFWRSGFGHLASSAKSLVTGLRHENEVRVDDDPLTIYRRGLLDALPVQMPDAIVGRGWAVVNRDASFDAEEIASRTTSTPKSTRNLQLDPASTSTCGTVQSSTRFDHFDAWEPAPPEPPSASRPSHVSGRCRSVLTECRDIVAAAQTPEAHVPLLQAMMVRLVQLEALVQEHVMGKESFNSLNGCSLSGIPLSPISSDPAPKPSVFDTPHTLSNASLTLSLLTLTRQATVVDQAGVAPSAASVPPPSSQAPPPPPPPAPPPPPPPPPPMPSAPLFKTGTQLIRRRPGDSPADDKVRKALKFGKPDLPDMKEILKGLGQVKLKHVQRSPGGRPKKVKRDNDGEEDGGPNEIANMLRRHLARRYTGTQGQTPTRDDEEDDDDKENQSEPDVCSGEWDSEPDVRPRAVAADGADTPVGPGPVCDGRTSVTLRAAVGRRSAKRLLDDATPSRDDRPPFGPHLLRRTGLRPQTSSLRD